jgi:hypothetical protein
MMHDHLWLRTRLGPRSNCMTEFSRPGDKPLQKPIDLAHDVEAGFKGLQAKCCVSFIFLRRWHACEGINPHSTYLKEQPEHSSDQSDWPRNEDQKNDPDDRHNKLISTSHDE